MHRFTAGGKRTDGDDVDAVVKTSSKYKRSPGGNRSEVNLEGIVLQTDQIGHGHQFINNPSNVDAAPASNSYAAKTHSS